MIMWTHLPPNFSNAMTSSTKPHTLTLPSRMVLPSINFVISLRLPIAFYFKWMCPYIFELRLPYPLYTWLTAFHLPLWTTFHLLSDCLTIFLSYNMYLTPTSYVQVHLLCPWSLCDSWQTLVDFESVRQSHDHLRPRTNRNLRTILYVVMLAAVGRWSTLLTLWPWDHLSSTRLHGLSPLC